MKTLVAGASGATGQQLVKQLLNRGHQVKALVRSAGRLPASIRDHENLTTIEASIHEMPSDALAEHVSDCSGVASCLGHHLSFKGVYGPPHRLVADSTHRLSHAAKATSSGQPARFVLMSSAGVRNRDLAEPVSAAQSCVIALLRACLPPHADNEAAADFLRLKVDRDNTEVEWAVVRPDNLINEETVSDYELHPSPVRSAIFDAGTTSRVNVAHFMAELLTDDELWEKWKHQMPVIYNRD